MKRNTGWSFSSNPAPSPGPGWRDYLTKQTSSPPSSSPSSTIPNPDTFHFLMPHSHSAFCILNSALACVVSGPSGSGKTTLCRAVAAVAPVYYTVSCTTRPQRPGEVHGRDYFFLTEQEFAARVA